MHLKTEVSSCQVHHALKLARARPISHLSPEAVHATAGNELRVALITPTGPLGLTGPYRAGTGTCGALRSRASRIPNVSLGHVITEPWEPAQQLCAACRLQLGRQPHSCTARAASTVGTQRQRANYFLKGKLICSISGESKFAFLK